MKGTQFRSPDHCTNIQEKKGYSSNEIILRKVSEINGFEKTGEFYNTPALSAGDLGNYLNSPLSDPFIVRL